MTGQNIIDFFNNLIGDELDATFALQLVNDGMQEIETELELEITKKLNSSNSTTAGQTSTTAITLPTDFLSPLDIYIGTEKYTPIPFEHQQFYKDSPARYWIDHGASQYHLCGTQGSAQTIYFFYQYATTVLTTTTSPVWPSRFHTLIAYEMARKYFLIDQPEKSRSWTPEYQAMYMQKKRQMIDWDAKLKLKAMDNSSFLDNQTLNTENRPPA